MQNVLDTAIRSFSPHKKSHFLSDLPLKQKNASTFYDTYDQGYLTFIVTTGIYIEISHKN